MLSKVLAGCAALCLSSVAASATTATYNFTGSSNSYSLTRTFTAAGGPNLTVTANTVSSDGSTITPVTGSGNGIGQWSYGIGIRNSSGDNIHTVDGYGLNDLLAMTFDTPVKILSATFGYAGIDNYSGDNLHPTDGFAFFADGADAGTSVAGEMVFDHQDIGANSSGFGTYDFTTDAFADIFSTSFAIAAIWDQTVQSCYWSYGRKKCTDKTYFDSFKLKSLVVELQPPSNVPIPGALPLLASALGLGGILARRRKSS